MPSEPMVVISIVRYSQYKRYTYLQTLGSKHLKESTDTVAEVTSLPIVTAAAAEFAQIQRMCRQAHPFAGRLAVGVHITNLT